MTPKAQRQAVKLVCEELKISERRCCLALGFGRSSIRYKIKRTSPMWLPRLKMLAAKYRRYGYRRLQAKLRQEGKVINHKQLYRVYCEEGLIVRKRKAKRKRYADGQRLALPPVTRRNQGWSMDFVSDSLANGRKIRSFNVLDLKTRECHKLAMDTSFPAERVIRELNQVAAKNGGYPEFVVVDNGPEFTSRKFDEWAHLYGVKIYFTRPGKPVDNAFIESFNGKFRDECLNENLFIDLLDARIKSEEWRIEYNHERPHSAIGRITPVQFAQILGLSQ